MLLVDLLDKFTPVIYRACVYEKIPTSYFIPHLTLLSVFHITRYAHKNMQCLDIEITPLVEYIQILSSSRTRFPPLRSNRNSQCMGIYVCYMTVVVPSPLPEVSCHCTHVIQKIHTW